MILGFKRKTYSISEGNGSVEVCVQVKSGVLRSSLNLSLATVDGSATGEQYPDYLGSIHSGIRVDCLLFTLECTVLFFFTIASADYTSKSIDLIFGPSIRKQCVLISVLNDTVPEVPEHFSVVLSMTTPLAGVILTPDNVTVVINDDDGECM